MIGVGLASLRGTRGRVAAMGVRRRAHRRGIGLGLGQALLGSLARAGAREVIPEALTINAPALALYEDRLGFRRRRRLVGFERPAGGEAIGASRWEEALAAGTEPDSWQLRRVVAAARAQQDLLSVPAVVPEAHAVAGLLRAAGFAEAPVDQFELRRSLSDAPGGAAPASA